MSTFPGSLPAVPPRVPGDLSVQPEPSSWPTVLGVIAIVLGSLGCFGGCWGAVSPLFIDAVLKMAPQGQIPAQAMDYQFKQWGPWITISSLIGMALAAFLLLTGIGLVHRRRWAVGAACWWSILKVIWVVITGVASIALQRGQFEAVAQQNPAGLGAGFFTVIVVVTAVLTLAWGWALPVFFLIWFSLKKTRRDIADWR